MSRKDSRLSRAKNFGFNTTNTPGATSFLGNDSQKNKVDLRNFISPVQLQRLRVDVSGWRDSFNEAERAYYPFRVKQQRIYIDTILNGHVASLMERRKDLTLLRKYEIVGPDGETVSKDLTQMMEEQMWFHDFMDYALDTLFFGYSLLSLGDIVNDQMSEVGLVPRWFCSPDRHQVGSYIYATSGIDWRDKPQSDWHIYIKTKNPNGTSPAGYGLFHTIALYEIFLRNTLGFNGDFVELYAQPYRVAKTSKIEESERAELEAAVRNMGSSGWAIIDPQDDISFLETSLAGTGWKSYESLEARCQKIVSKIILGHSDAMDSTPGKLGSGQGSGGGIDGADMDGSPVSMALMDKQTKDARFIMPVINQQLFPKLAALGLKIPTGYTLKFSNDDEEQSLRAREDQSNSVTATIAQTMKNAGLKMDAKYFTDRTGIPCEAIEEPDPLTGLPPGQKPTGPAGSKKSPVNPKIKNKLDQLYK